MALRIIHICHKSINSRLNKQQQDIEMRSPTIDIYIYFLALAFCGSLHLLTTCFYLVAGLSECTWLPRHTDHICFFFFVSLVIFVHAQTVKLNSYCIFTQIDWMSKHCLQNVYYAFYITEFKQACTLKWKVNMLSLLFLHCLVRVIGKDRNFVVVVLF